MNAINIKFNVFFDTPPGKDPDQHSPTLRLYHQLLWSKPLPNGENFILDLSEPKLLRHSSENLGEFTLSSDGIGRTFVNIKKMKYLVDLIPSEVFDPICELCYTIGAFIIFPSNRVNMKPTINGARGMNSRIEDRFDLTLECIRLFYNGDESPLSKTLMLYRSFFELFKDFRGYVNHFLLQDLVTNNFNQINFWHPFTSFDKSPLPSNQVEFHLYLNKVAEFVQARNERIFEYSKRQIASSDC
jgi:hypothetical protein